MLSSSSATISISIASAQRSLALSTPSSEMSSCSVSMATCARMSPTPLVIASSIARDARDSTDSGVNVRFTRS
jgi:hypothetical protein